MSDTPYLGLPEIATGQSDKSSTHNDALQILDIIVQRGIVDKDLTAPPGSPTTGAAYIVGASATGAWAGHDDEIAYYRSGWVFVTPWEGLTVWVNDEDKRYTHDGSGWVVSIGGTSFLDLGDTPNSYSSQAGKLTAVNGAEDEIEFITNTKIIIVAVTDETTAITTGTNKLTFRMPFAMTLTSVRGSLTTASSSGGPVTVDINEGGSTILSTKLTIDDGEKTSTTAATPPVISDSALADDAEITIDIDTAGTGATGLKVTLIGTPA